MRNAEFGMGNAERELKAHSSKLKGEAADTTATSIQYPESSIQHPVPIIAMTAHAMAGDEDKSLQAGMNGHVAKPIDPDYLFSILQKWIKPSEKRGQIQPTEVPAELPESDKAMPGENELPVSLAGFDLPAGLVRLRGNKSLYRKLLLDFGTKEDIFN